MSLVLSHRGGTCQGNNPASQTGRKYPNCPGMLLALLAVALLAIRPQAGGQPPEGFLLTNEIRNARAQLQWQRPGLPSAELDHLAEFIGRSNHIAKAIGSAFRANDLTNATRLLEQFPGRLDDVRDFGQPLLYRAAMGGNDAQLSFLLEHQANPDLPAPQGETPLTAAINARHWWGALRLVLAGASVSDTNALSQPPLALLLNGWWSGSNKDDQASLVEAMLDHGADPFAPSSPGNPRSILEQALIRGHEDLAEQLLTNRPSPKRLTPQGDTAIHLAARWGLTNAIDLLLKAGFSPEETNADGLTPLQCIADSVEEATGPMGQRVMGQRSIIIRSAWNSTPSPTMGDVATFLLGRGARLDVFCAAGLGRTNELAAMLRVNPALANARDGLGRTPLHYASATQPRLKGTSGMATPPNPPSTRTNPISTAVILLGAGANPAAATIKPVPSLHRDPGAMPAGATPLHLAALRGDEEVIQALLAAGAPVAVSDAVGDTALHLAAHSWLTNCTVRLLAAQAPMDVTNRANRTPLRVAVEWRSSANTQILLKAGARPGLGLGQDTLVHLAAENGDIPTLTVLLAHRQPLEARDKTGATPFLRAATTHQRDVLEWLRSKGADVNATDLRRNTAMHLLAPQQNDEVFHPVDQRWWARWMQRSFSGPGLASKALSLLINAKIVPPPPPPRWTNTSLTVWLLAHGGRADLTNALGETPLHLLCGESWASFDNPATSNRLAILLGADPRLDRVDRKGRTPLQIALTNLAPELVSWLLTRSGSVDTFRDAKGRTFLHEAVANSDVSNLQRSGDMIRMLLNRHANPDVQDTEGLTPLHLAMRGFVSNLGLPVHDVVSLLLTNGANPNLPAKDGRTPLHLLAASYDPRAHPGDRIGPLLLSSHCDFAARDRSGQTPVHGWASNLDTGCGACAAFFRSVLTNLSLVNLTNAAGDTPLHLAARARRDQTCSILLAAGADPARRNARGETVYRLAALNDWVYPQPNGATPRSGPQGFFNSLFSRDESAFGRWLDADPTVCNLTNGNGLTPLMAATERNLTPTSDRLLALGATVDLLSAMRLGRWDDFEKELAKTKGQILSDWLFESAARRNPRALKELAGAGGDLHAVDSDGHSLVYRASASGEIGLTEWLRDHGCAETIFDALARRDRAAVESFLRMAPLSLATTNRNGISPLLSAAISANDELVSLLLERGAKTTDRTGGGWSLLHISAAKNSLALGRRMLQAGLDPNEIALGGLGPLHLAAAYGHSEFAEMLIENGANPSLRPPEDARWSGYTPLHWAATKGHAATVRVLLAHGADPTVPNRAGQTPAMHLRGIPFRTSWGFLAPPGLQPAFSVLSDEATRQEILALLDSAAPKAGQ